MGKTLHHKPIYVVSGLPRSGTSMMMKMLEAGGIPVLTDQIRKADIDNPKGYFELEKVKQIREDTSWLESAQGKAFKMVSLLLLDLPDTFQYKILFMRRELQEILTSEKKMLDRLGKSRDIPDTEMARIFEKHLAHVEAELARRPCFETMYLSYNTLLKHPEEIIDAIPEFLDLALDTDRMAGVIDPALYRNRQT